jgi:hypothetical protein
MLANACYTFSFFLQESQLYTKILLILVSHHPAVQMLNVTHKAIKQSAHVFPLTLEEHLIVDQSAQLTPIVHPLRLALTKNVKIHAPVHVD